MSSIYSNENDNVLENVIEVVKDIDPNVISRIKKNVEEINRIEEVEANRISDHIELLDDLRETINILKNALDSNPKTSETYENELKQLKEKIKNPDYLTKIVNTFNNNIDEFKNIELSTFEWLLLKEIINKFIKLQDDDITEDVNRISIDDITEDVNRISIDDITKDVNRIAEIDELTDDQIKTIMDSFEKMNFKELLTIIDDKLEKKNLAQYFYSKFYRGGKKKGKKSTRKKYKMNGGGSKLWIWVIILIIIPCVLSAGIGCIIIAVGLPIVCVLYDIIDHYDKQKKMKIEAQQNELFQEREKLDNKQLIRISDEEGGTKKHKRITRRKRNTRRKRKFLKLNRKLSKNMRRK